jgi:hypothetical protein
VARPAWGGTDRGALRVLLVGAAALGVLLPFFTDRLIGGTDARWYATMLHDFVAQLRAGVFPVFIGQGEFAWNGAVHLFRSAPVYMHVAGAWDFLTWRVLNAPALQHLAILTGGASRGLGFLCGGRGAAAGAALDGGGICGALRDGFGVARRAVLG